MVTSIKGDNLEVIHPVAIDSRGSFSSVKAVEEFHTSKPEHVKTSLVAITEENSVLSQDYLRTVTSPVSWFNHKFLISGTPCSSVKRHFLIILCLSKYDHVTTRDSIRKTWGSVATSGVWPMEIRRLNGIKLVFLLGRGGDKINKTDMESFANEHKTFGDVVVSDFVDSYWNLTRKVISGFKWVGKYCKHPRFILKVDEDTFIHVANLVNHLKSINTTTSSAFIGHWYKTPPVLRTGKWAVANDVYPFSYFPEYLSGNSYVISGDIIPKLTTAVEHLPYLFIEDVAITGIGRVAVNGSLVNDEGFTAFSYPPPTLCHFHNTTLKAATKTDDTLRRKLWTALHMTLEECNKFANASSQMT